MGCLKRRESNLLCLQAMYNVCAAWEVEKDGRLLRHRFLYTSMEAHWKKPLAQYRRKYADKIILSFKTTTFFFLQKICFPWRDKIFSYMHDALAVYKNVIIRFTVPSSVQKPAWVGGNVRTDSAALVGMFVQLIVDTDTKSANSWMKPSPSQ